MGKKRKKTICKKKKEKKKEKYSSPELKYSTASWRNKAQIESIYTDKVF
tara:strand:+ start:2253 stop:2399 length:147 start_codon:yes stop_codon:yes gene_type:complete